MARSSLGTICLLVPLVLAGCQQSNSVHGTVSYDGEPVKGGSIMFMPADGQGTLVGAQIREGRYVVYDPSPGKYVAKIEAAGQSAVPQSSEESFTRAMESAQNPVPDDFTPQNAIGNMQEVEIEPGSQTLDFDLKPPVRR